MRQFADSWGLVYMFAIFLAVVAAIVVPGASRRARDASQIPLNDDHALAEDADK
jgi:cytochrome c oxidase cbb3-type subunit 4